MFVLSPMCLCWWLVSLTVSYAPVKLNRSKDKVDYKHTDVLNYWLHYLEKRNLFIFFFSEVLLAFIYCWTFIEELSIWTLRHWFCKMFPCFPLLTWWIWCCVSVDGFLIICNCLRATFKNSLCWGFWPCSFESIWPYKGIQHIFFHKILN